MRKWFYNYENYAKLLVAEYVVFVTVAIRLGAPQRLRRVS